MSRYDTSKIKPSECNTTRTNKILKINSLLRGTSRKVFTAGNPL